MIHANAALAERIERASAALGRDAVQAHRALFVDSEAASLDCGSGVAVFLNEDSPLTQVRGAGGAEFSLDEVEQFFTERMTPVIFTLTPFAQPALWTQLAARGYEFGTFENVMVRAVSPADAAEAGFVQEAADPLAWSRTLAETFFGSVTPMGLDLCRTLYAIPSCRNVCVPGEEAPVAGAQLDVRDGLAVFQCDGTAPACRGMGLHTAMIRARLAMAAEAGCDLATADTAPGSQSQRNYERAGFQVAYTKVTLVKPCF
ncbi:MAG TPA: hypothetical protein VFQ91_01110 [Bryobacteraceae bacterium]|nr:hypothetical protein [Bryobacteraceae bacterium]